MEYRIGLVGCGGIATYWIRALAQTDRCAIELVFDLDASAAAARAEEVEAKAATDLTDRIFEEDE